MLVKILLYVHGMTSCLARSCHGMACMLDVHRSDDVIVAEVPALDVTR